MSKHQSEELDNVLAQYVWQGKPRVIPGPSGMNNTTVMIEDDQDKRVVRIYNNHADRSKLQFEHTMLAELKQTRLAIATPQPIANKQHSIITQLQNGKLAAAFVYIDGERPSAENMQSMVSLADAAAQLSKAFAQLQIEEAPAYTPYYELESNYPPFDNNALQVLLEDAQLAKQKDELLLIQAERVELEQLKPQLQVLPHQWIHGDLNCSNSLAIRQSIVAVLDFEFVTWDLRAMELAVLLSEMIKPTTEQLEPRLEAMLQAFIATVPLQKEELTLLPALIKLRSVDVAMHFIERFKQGLDSPEVLCGIIAHAAYVITCMNQLKLVTQ